jgi:hypothetical protein
MLDRSKCHASCDRAKRAKQKPGWKKPTRGKLLPPIPKPAKVVPEPDDDGEPDESSDDDGDDDDDDHQYKYLHYDVA